MTRRSRRREHRAGEAARQHPGAPAALDVMGSVALTLIGGMLGIVFLPLVWVFVDRLLDPGPKDELGETLVQLAIAVAFCGGAWATAGSRYRVAVDAATQSVTWTRSLFGLPLHRVRWAARRSRRWRSASAIRCGAIGTMRSSWSDRVAAGR